jgi:TetR/AcrR family transcriptional repressor of nem operon
MPRAANPSTRSKLLDAAFAVIRVKGYTTTVDDICAEAGLSKGAFFHQFRSKEDLAVSAAQHWSEMTGTFFKDAAYHDADDPLARVVGHVAFRKELIRGALSEFTCLVGTMTQEAYGTSSAIQEVCWDSIFGHAATLVPDVEADWMAESLALRTQAVIQGAFILAKASGDPRRTVESIDHLYRYIKRLFGASAP